MRERERERETYQWEEEKIVMNRKKNLLVDGGGRDCRLQVQKSENKEINQNKYF